VWKNVAYEGNPRSGINRGGSTYANETPATDGKRVYVYFGTLGMFCYDMEGNLLWQKDLGAYKTLNEWGTGSSPVVYQDILYQQVDNEESSFVVALDAATGEQIWKAEREEKTNYSTPVIWKNGIRTELVTSGKSARSYDLKTGNVLWELKVGGEMNIPSAVPYKDRLYIGNAGGRETSGTLFAVKAGAQGDITPPEGELVSSGVEWSVPDAGTSNPSPLLYKGLIYLLASRGGDISCFDASTGKLIYKEKVDKVAACWASPWANNDKIYFLDEKGVTHIINAGEKFEVLSRNKLDDRFWASPAITRDAYIFKGVKSLYCIKY
jgi:outer membrane protein assembly factor BamB